VLPDAAFAEARAVAFAEIELTVTSPPKSDRPETVTVAVATPPLAETLDATEDACATEPSAGYANEPPTPTASGGAETLPAIEPPWPGTDT
jgi:hypothetical protein